VPSFLGSSIRVVLRGSGSEGCCQASPRSPQQRSSKARLAMFDPCIDSMQRTVRSGRCSDGMTIATVFHADEAVSRSSEFDRGGEPACRIRTVDTEK